MHEFSIIKGIIDQLTNYANDNNIKQINRISLEIGELQNIIPEHLKFCFDAAKKDTITENAELDFKIIQPLIKCNNCDKEFILKDMNFVCSYCNNIDLVIVKGREITIKSIEIDE